eukprot:15432965-Alexandrium_andersonii.AAC.2
MARGTALDSLPRLGAGLRLRTAPQALGGLGLIRSRLLQLRLGLSLHPRTEPSSLPEQPGM